MHDAKHVVVSDPRPLQQITCHVVMDSNLKGCNHIWPEYTASVQFVQTSLFGLHLPT